MYLGLVILPLAALWFGHRPRGGGFWWDFALALGYAGLAMMGIQFALTARFKRTAAPFGIDLVYFFHRYLATVAFALVLLHAAVLGIAYPGALGGVDPRVAPVHLTISWLALIAFALLLASSWWRKRIGIEYDHWRRWHLALALLGVTLSIAHVEGSASYLASPLKQVIWIALPGFWMALVVWVRVVRPSRLQRSPYRVVEVRKERGRSWTLALAPEHPPTLTYRAGQFAWLSVRASPFAMREHPFSFSSSPTRKGPLEFTIKELGDFTATIGSLQPGERVYVDGPYGAFGTDRHADAPGLVLIAGGIGIAPIISMLRAMADGGDTRPLYLFYGNRRWDRVVFREEIDALGERLQLQCIHVLIEPADDWTGERGYVTRDVLQRHLPTNAAMLQYFVCGPTPMIRLVERSLGELGVPLARLHSEIFDLA